MRDSMTLSVTSNINHADICDIIESTMMSEDVRARFFKKVSRKGYCYYKIIEPRVALRLLYHELSGLMGSDEMWNWHYTQSRLELMERRQTKLHHIWLTLNRAAKHFSYR